MSSGEDHTSTSEEVVLLHSRIMERLQEDVTHPRRTKNVRGRDLRYSEVEEEQEREEREDRLLQWATITEDNPCSMQQLQQPQLGPHSQQPQQDINSQQPQLGPHSQQPQQGPHPRADQPCGDRKHGRWYKLEPRPPPPLKHYSELQEAVARGKKRVVEVAVAGKPHSRAADATEDAGRRSSATTRTNQEAPHPQVNVPVITAQQLLDSDPETVSPIPAARRVADADDGPPMDRNLAASLRVCCDLGKQGRVKLTSKQPRRWCGTQGECAHETNDCKGIVSSRVPNTQQGARGRGPNRGARGRSGRGEDDQAKPAKQRNPIVCHVCGEEGHIAFSSKEDHLLHLAMIAEAEFRGIEPEDHYQQAAVQHWINK